MSSDGEDLATADGETVAVEAVPEEESGNRMDLTVEVESTGPCRKHVVVTVSEADIAAVRDESVEELGETAAVPGFRVGRAPKDLLQKRFRSEIVDQVKQKVLLQSLEQLSEDKSIDPINQPDIDVESLDIPETGDFRFEFDVEVRPEFTLPDYRNFEIERPSGDISEEESAAYRAQFLQSYAVRNTVDRAAAKGDFVVADLRFVHDGTEIRESEDVALHIQRQLRFQDSVIEGFDELIAGAVAGDTRKTEAVISVQSPVVEMRGERVEVQITVNEVQEQVLPKLDSEFFDQVGCDSEEDFEAQLKSSLDRQIEYQQRQSTRGQVTEKIVDAADWDLPESLVQQQTENALRREVLEMSQAGFTREQIAARENEIRQNAIETTRQALKEHFVLDRIATEENIDCEDADIEHELMMMAFQSGEPVRRIRARMVKNGMIENMEAQLRERKAVDFILEHAKFTDTEREPFAENDVATVQFAICGNMTSSLIDDTVATAE